jgi:hypothetical protein
MITIKFFVSRQKCNGAIIRPFFATIEALIFSNRSRRILSNSPAVLVIVLPTPSVPLEPSSSVQCQALIQVKLL